MEWNITVWFFAITIEFAGLWSLLEPHFFAKIVKIVYFCIVAEEIMEHTVRDNRFRKGERLRLRTLVNNVYADGKSIYEWPLRAVWLPACGERLERLFPHGVPSGIGRLQMMVTIPKRKRKHAVDRVLLRRRVREAWRLRRHALREALEGRGDVRTLSVAINYVADDNRSYAEIERAIDGIIEKIIKKLGKGDRI